MKFLVWFLVFTIACIYFISEAIALGAIITGLLAFGSIASFVRETGATPLDFLRMIAGLGLIGLVIFLIAVTAGC